jgi:CheY-like chemotaxis protein
VLLGNESAAVRLLLGSLLRDDDRFALVGDGASGAEIIARCDEADLVVVDLMLNDIDAFSLIDQLRARRAGLPVVLYAEVDPPYLRAEATTRGAVAFFTHHMDPADVLDGLAAAANRVGS